METVFECIWAPPPKREGAPIRLRIEPFAYVLVASTLAVLSAVVLGQDSLERALFATRFTARTGLPLVLAIYTASAFHRLWPGPLTQWLAQNRRSLGLAFALSHTVHLVAVFEYIATPGSLPQPPLGIVGYVLIYLMAFSSNPRAMRQIGQWRHRLHALGVNWIFLNYIFGYVSMLVEPDMRIVGLLVLPLLVAALIVQVAAWQKARTQQAQL